MDNFKPVTLVSVSDEKSDWGGNISYDYAPIKNYLLKAKENIGINWKESNKGIFMIEYKNSVYTYWPKTGKWRARGSRPIYKSKNIHQFFMKYVLKYLSEKEAISYESIMLYQQ